MPISAQNAVSLAIGAGDLHSAAMSNQAPLHLFEVFFYSTAALLVATGVTWLLLR